jgi:meso-butanediol dehydrogenase/(S,S)-butanediol dehydrogenase/diacetyl reductase
MLLDGKVALVTGGGTGIGAAIAKRFVQDGAKVCIAGRRREKLEETAASVSEGAIDICPGDVSSHEDIKKMVEQVVKFGGKLDVLVNCAGTGSTGSVTEIPLEEWQKVLDVNLTGPLLLMKESIPHMIKNGRGSIINIASIGGLRCLPGQPGYCTTKAALIMLTKQVALDYGPQNVRCNVVCPGGTITDMTLQMMRPLSESLGTDLAGAYNHWTRNIPLRRVAEAGEIAGLCSYLASDDSSFMTGAQLVIDGGNTIVDVQGIADGN